MKLIAWPQWVHLLYTQKLIHAKIEALWLSQENAKFYCIENFNVYGSYTLTLSKESPILQQSTLIMQSIMLAILCLKLYEVQG